MNDLTWENKRERLYQCHEALDDELTELIIKVDELEGISERDYEDFQLVLLRINVLLRDFYEELYFS